MNKCNILALYVFLEFTKEFSMGNIISQLLNLGESEKFGHDLDRCFIITFREGVYGSGGHVCLAHAMQRVNYIVGLRPYG